MAETGSEKIMIKPGQKWDIYGKVIYNELQHFYSKQFIVDSSQKQYTDSEVFNKTMTDIQGPARYSYVTDRSVTDCFRLSA